MIPKTIYYTWINEKPLPEQFEKYLKSWSDVMPDYEIKQISLDNIKRGEFVDKAISIKNYALAGHYGRCQELFENGGIYFDIDVEAVKPFDDLLDYECFIGWECENFINNAVMGCEKGHKLMKDCMDYMDAFDLDHPQIELETGPRMFTKLAKNRADVKLLPPFCFYPYHYSESFKEECVKPETYAIHHWAHTWKK